MKSNKSVFKGRLFLACLVALLSAALFAGPAQSLEFKWDTSGRQLPTSMTIEKTNSDTFGVFCPILFISNGFNCDTFPLGCILFVH